MLRKLAGTKYSPASQEPAVAEPAGDPLYRFLARYSILQVWLWILIVHLTLYFTVGLYVDFTHPGPEESELFVSIRELAELVNGFSVWVIFVPTIWAYFRWLPTTALSLANKAEADGIIRKEPRQGESFLPLSVQLRTALFDPANNWVVLTCTAIGYAFFYFFAIPFQEEALEGINFWYYTPFSFSVMSILFVVNCTIVLLLALRALRMVAVLNRFFRQPEVVVNLLPLHPDGGGGLGGFGKVISRISLIAVLIALWATIYSLYPVLNGGTPQWPAVAVVYVLYLMVVPAVIFISLWMPHLAMAEYKSRRLEAISRRLFELQENCLASLEKENAWRMEEKTQQVEQLTRLYYYFDNQIPAWPLSYRGFQRFTAAASSPLIVGLLTLIGERII